MKEETAGRQSDSDSSAIRREKFCQFTRNFRSSRPSSRNLCMLTDCEVSVPEEKVTWGTSIRLETLEKLPDERVTGQPGSMGLHGPGGKLEDLHAGCRIPEFPSTIGWLSRVAGGAI